jgi:hypothetical protein
MITRHISFSLGFTWRNVLYATPPNAMDFLMGFRNQNLGEPE